MWKSSRMGLPTQLLCVCLCLAMAQAGHGKNWALLIAGSNGWLNYSAQSSVCHAYQTLHKAGIPDENIVVMMYDDIANNTRNPHPGKIFNRYNGPDVYAGVPKDYTGKEINKKTFLAVLRGDKKAIRRLIGRDGKVIEAGFDDNIFLFYIDHGGPKIVEMPNGEPVLHARELNDTLTEMHKLVKYRQVLIYLEACHSGSMFDKILSPRINVFATTAANPFEDAYMIECDTMGTCLSGEYSCNWQRDNDVANLHNETVEVQFQNTKANTHKSDVSEYGNLNITQEDLDIFFGASPDLKPSVGKVRACDRDHPNGIPIPMAKMHLLRSKLAAAPAFSSQRYEVQAAIQEEEKLMADTEVLFTDIARKAFKNQIPESKIAPVVFNPYYDDLLDYDCYEDAVDLLFALCPSLRSNKNPYAITKLVSLLHACNAQRYKTVIRAVKEVAQDSHLCELA